MGYTVNFIKSSYGIECFETGIVSLETTDLSESLCNPCVALIVRGVGFKEEIASPTWRYTMMLNNSSSKATPAKKINLEL